MLRLLTKYGYSDTWWRVMFIDTDNTFIGRLERRDRFEYKEHNLDDDVRLKIKDIRKIYDNEQFCYSDNVTLCNCDGLCENK